jgi:hypothetical protein
MGGGFGPLGDAYYSMKATVTLQALHCLASPSEMLIQSKLFAVTFALSCSN